MITAFLSFFTIWCLFYGQLARLPLLGVSLAVSLIFSYANHHHEGTIDIDILAHQSKLNHIDAALKFWTVLILMFLCISSNSYTVGFFLVILMMAITVIGGGIPFESYFRMLSTPFSFLMISGLALLFDFGHEALGVLNLHIVSFYIFITPIAQTNVLVILSKAIGAVSCLYFLSLSTPMTELISAMRKTKIPGVVIDLMYLIYRYTFVLLDIYRTMKDAAKSRMGFSSFKISVKSTGLIYANLLARSYQKAQRNFDAMESRCYAGEIRFLEKKTERKLGHYAAACIMVVFTVSIFVL